MCVGKHFRLKLRRLFSFVCLTMLFGCLPVALLSFILLFGYFLRFCPLFFVAAVCLVFVVIDVSVLFVVLFLLPPPPLLVCVCVRARGGGGRLSRSEIAI